MPSILKREQFPAGYVLIRQHTPCGNYLQVFCLATGKYVGNGRHYTTTRAALIAAKRSDFITSYNEVCRQAA